MLNIIKLFLYFFWYIEPEKNLNKVIVSLCLKGKKPLFLVYKSGKVIFEEYTNTFYKPFAISIDKNYKVTGYPKKNKKT